MKTALSASEFLRPLFLPAVLGFMLASTSDSAAADPALTFSATTNFSVGTPPNRVAIGDLNGDLIPDIAVASFNSNIVSIFLGTGDGSFYIAIDLIAALLTRSVAIADLDGDGKPDVAVANLSCCINGHISVFKNTSTGGTLSFASKVDFPIGFQPYSIAIGDMDGDNKPDLVAVLIGQFDVAVLRNTSTSGSITTSSFASPVYRGTGLNPWGVAVGDVDGDGKPDLAVVNLTSNNVSVFRNTATIGSISFEPRVDFATGLSPRSVAIADLDGDGKLDLAVANQNSNTVSVLRNTSTSGSITAGSFDGKVDFPTGDSPYSVSAGDLGADGKLDLAVTNQSNSTVSVLRNTGTSGSITASSFDSKVDFPTGLGSHGGAIGDLNGDGKLDLVVANKASSTVSVLLNTTDTTPPDTTITSAKDGNAAAVAPGGSTPSNSITLTFVGTDNVGVASFQCRLDAAVYAACVDPVGYSALGIGSHTVQVRALDTAGNIDPSAASFSWSVVTPTQAIQNLIATINGLGLSRGLTNSLIAPLSNIDPDNEAAACGKLNAFINQVNAKTPPLTTAQATQLLQAANAIKASLGCA